MSTSMRRASAFLFLLCGMLSGFGQQRKPAAVTLRELTRQSGYIFAGRVTAIEYVAPKTPNQVATMRVTFHVEQAFRGTRAGTTYRVGERVLLFLHRSSKLGLTSPVGGAQGRFALDKDGQVVMDSNAPPCLNRIRAFGGRRTRCRCVTSAGQSAGHKPRSTEL